MNTSVLWLWIAIFPYSTVDVLYRRQPVYRRIISHLAFDIFKAILFLRQNGSLRIDVLPVQYFVYIVIYYFKYKVIYCWQIVIFWIIFSVPIFLAYLHEISSFRVQFVLLLIAKVHSRRWSFLFLVVLSFRGDQREPAREYLYGIVSREEACNRANDHQSAFRNLVRLLIRTCPRTHWQSAEWAGSHVVCSCCPFWRFPDESSQGSFLLKTLRHTITQGVVTFVHDVTVSKSFGHPKSVAFIGRVT